MADVGDKLRLQACGIERGIACALELRALGTVELHRGNFAEAQVLCEEALRARPESLYARVHRAEALLFQGKREEAESELKEIINADSDSPHGRTARALLDAADLITTRDGTTEQTQAQRG